MGYISCLSRLRWLSAHKKKKEYIHKQYKLGWFRFSFYKLHNKFTIRFEISKGWDK
jgi:hypothetical protein